MPDPSKPTSRTLWGVVGVLAAGHFVNDFYALYLAALRPTLVERFDLSGAAAGAVASVFTVSASLSQPFMGWLGDRIRRHAAIVLAMAMAAVLLSLLAHAQSVWLVVVLLVGGGLGVSVYHPNSGLLVREASAGRDVAMAVFISCGAVGVFAAPMFAGWCAAEGGPLWLLPWSMLLGLAMAAIIAATPLPRPARPARPPRFRELFQRAHAPLYLLLAIGAMRSLTQMTFNFHIQDHIKDQHWQEVYQRLFLGAFLFSAAVGGIIGGLLSNRVGRRRVIVSSSLVGGVLLILAPQGSLGVTALGLILGGLAFGAATPVSVVLGQDMAPAHASAVTGVMTGFAWGLGGLLLPAIGAIQDATNPAWALRVGAAAAILAGGLALALKEPARRSGLEVRSVEC